MSVPNSRGGVLDHFNGAPERVRSYLRDLPGLLESFPLDVSLSYLFAQVELAHNMTLSCGVIKLHKANAAVARMLIDTHRMTQADFRAKCETVLGHPIPDDVVEILKKAETIRDKVMHGTATSASEKREAITQVIDYAVAYNSFLSGVASYQPFGDLRGLKGRAEPVDKPTTRWMLKGMGFLQS